MINIEYHKGTFCVYENIFCQEGLCSGCNIYKKRTSDKKYDVSYTYLKSPERNQVHQFELVTRTS